MNKPSILRSLLNKLRAEPVTEATSKVRREHHDAALPPEQELQISQTIGALRAKVADSFELPALELTGQSGPFRSSQHFFDSSFQSFEDLLRYTTINPDSRVLDYGCGLARLAIPLAGYLTGPEARYQGVDTDMNCIRRGQQVFARYPQLGFRHVDLFSTMYNKGGKDFSTLAEQDFGGPFDLAILFSVFTHILPEHCDLLLRVLRDHLGPGGELFCSWFLLNGETQAAIDQGLAHRSFPHPHGKARIDNLNVPEGAVAYLEEDVLERFEKLGFRNLVIHFGGWRGDRERRVWQDVIVAKV
jgi:SAM-dependent methyltransferase